MKQSDNRFYREKETSKSTDQIRAEFFTRYMLSPLGALAREFYLPQLDPTHVGDVAMREIFSTRLVNTLLAYGVKNLIQLRNMMSTPEGRGRLYAFPSIGQKSRGELRQWYEQSGN